MYTKGRIMHDIMRVGEKLQFERVRDDKLNDAYQITHARQVLATALMKNGKQGFLRTLVGMVNVITDSEGYKHYDPMLFVADDMLREELRQYLSDYRKVLTNRKCRKGGMLR